MKFRFDISLTDQDYLDYNLFMLLKSPYNKNMILTFRIIVSAFFAIIPSIPLLSNEFSTGTIVGIILILTVIVLYNIFFAKSFARTIKSNMKKQKKKGKLSYTPLSSLEFYDDKFIETSPLNKTEQSYAAIERISIVENRLIYIHENRVVGYIIPRACFSSPEEFVSFIEFIKTKNSNIQCY